MTSWKVLIISKDEEDHYSTRLMFMKSDSYDGCKLEFLSTYNIEEAKKMISENTDTAVILFDVSTEKDNGLDFVRYVREDLNNSSVRIILHSAISTLLDEDDRIMSYDIDDFKEDHKLTLAELFVSVTNSINSYRNKIIKQALIKEIHHRVKNNLQMMSSILRLQGRYSGNSEFSKDITKSINRIDSLALIQEKLYVFENLYSIGFSDYIQDLIKNLCESNKIDKDLITVNLDIDKNIYLNIDNSIPCGLIINELISNSLKHAFPNRQKGTLNIQFHRNKDNNLSLIISDNGVGLPQDFDIQNANTLGLTLVELLTQQLDANIQIERINGTSFKIEFKDTDEPYI
jgi:two-component sensor histidine kinase